MAGWVSSPSTIRTIKAMVPPTTTRLMTNVDTQPESVTAPSPEPFGADGPSVGRRWWVAGPLIGLGIAALLLAVFLPLPYYAIAPGSLRETEPLVSVRGGQSYDSEGEVLFPTVSVEQVTPLEALTGWLDPAVDVRPDDEVLGGRDADENRQYNLQLMDTSKDAAIRVAFERLGYDIATGNGAEVTGIAPDLPVADALESGDTVLEVDGDPIEFSEDLVVAIREHEPGETVELSVESPEGETRTESVQLGARPDDLTAPLLGVGAQTRDLELDMPFDVAIDSGNVGGPSAGLAFTLAILDELTPGDLTGGAEVAATGTMNGLEEVGRVGGVAQKVEAAEDAGADVFLVPADEAAEAEEHADDDLRIVGVVTLDDALAALEDAGGDISGIEDAEPAGAST